ncbi:MAG: hypothetical protein NC131_22010 [Roseburia sp.]|nr:hypothetical protein [Roseburia sp.]
MFDVNNNEYRLVIAPNGGEAVDASELILEAQWGGRIGSPTRTFEATVIDYDEEGYERIDIDPERGDQCILCCITEEKETIELFRGMIMTKSHSSDRTMSFKAYDLGIYLSNNKDTFCYSNKTASDIFNDVCGRFGIPTGTVDSTSYTIPEMASAKTTGWDAIADALEQTYENTGVRYAVVAQEGKLNLLERRKNLLQYLLEPNKNMSEYEFECSIEKIRTRVKAYDKEDTVVAEAVDSALEAKIGMFQDVETADDEMTQAQVQAKVETSLNEVNKPDKTFNVTTLGAPDVVAGVGVFIRIEELDIEQSYYVDEDTHTLSDSHHMMDLSLVMTQDV